MFTDINRIVNSPRKIRNGTNLLDEWFECEVKPRLRGEAYEIRFADDGAPRRRGKEAVM